VFARRNAIWWVAVLIVALLPQVARSGTSIAVLNQMCIMVIFSLSYNMMLGQGGMLSFGHAVYFGLGGYVAIHFMKMAAGSYFLPLPLVPLIGGLAGLCFGLIIGSFSTNRAGTVFAMISLGIGELIAASSLIFVKFSGGEEGITADRTDLTSVFGIQFRSELAVYYLIGAWMLISAWLMYRFSRTPVGRMANAVRDNPERAEFVGYSQRQVRLISFMAAGFFAGEVFPVATDLVCAALRAPKEPSADARKLFCWSDSLRLGSIALISTMAVPFATTPSLRAAEYDRSMMRLPWKGPRSLIFTTALRPFVTLVTRA